MQRILGIAVFIYGVHRADTAETEKIFFGCTIDDLKEIARNGSIFFVVEATLVLEEKTEFFIAVRLTGRDREAFVFTVSESDAEAGSAGVFFRGCFAASNRGTIGYCTVDRTIHAEAGGISIFNGDVSPMAIFKEVKHEALTGGSIVCAGCMNGVDDERFKAAIFEIYGIARIKIIVEIEHIQSVCGLADGFQDS